MRPFPFAVTVSVVALAIPLVLATGCDQLNKPFHTTSSSSSSSSGSSRTTTDGGDGSDEAGTLAPAPTITAQPGDIQL